MGTFSERRFPAKRRSKLVPRGDGPFELLERIGENAYKLDHPSEYQVNVTLNVSDLSLFDVGSSLRTDSLQEMQNDIIHSSLTSLNEKDEALEAPTRPMTNSQTNRHEDKLNEL